MKSSIKQLRLVYQFQFKFQFLLMSLFLFLFSSFTACKDAAGGKEDAPAGGAADAPVNTIVPVRVAAVTQGPVTSSFELNASTSFLRKNEVRSTAIGYVSRINVQLGDQVLKGALLFQLKTKEAKALGGNLFPNDTSLHFSGLIPIKASESGFVTAISHQSGDFVQEGDSMCTIADLKSLAFIVNVPFELNQSVATGMNVEVKLPDGRHFEGTIVRRLPVMDPVSQTESFIVKTPLHTTLPENLIARVRISKLVKQVAVLVPKAALLSNEEQNEFWVMQVKDVKTAIKHTVKKGVENGGQVELLESDLKAGDKVLVTGNYGLSDTAAIKIVQ